MIHQWRVMLEFMKHRIEWGNIIVLREWVPLLQSMYVHVHIVKNVKLPIIIQNHLPQHIRHQVPPFEVWQVELVGPLPISPQGYSYVLTAVDMINKYLISIPLANKDTITVASGLTQIQKMYLQNMVYVTH